MQVVHNIDYKKLLISCGISLGVGGLSALISMMNQKAFEAAQKPPLTPPGWLFPIVWSILYILMGISAYLIYKSKVDTPETKTVALIIYGVQLIVNFFWSIIFFNLEAYLFAFIWILLLLFLIVVMIKLFYPINKLAAILQIPYLLWVAFATYLTFGVLILN